MQGSMQATIRMWYGGGGGGLWFDIEHSSPFLIAEINNRAGQDR